MKIILLGATGLVGRAVAAALEPRHEIVSVSRTSAIRADLADSASLDALFETPADAVVCCAANVPLRPLTGLTDEQVLDDLRAKLARRRPRDAGGGRRRGLPGPRRRRRQWHHRRPALIRPRARHGPRRRRPAVP
jgi:uncharacterized protein YbjT (DUF2867 family)